MDVQLVLALIAIFVIAYLGFRVHNLKRTVVEVSVTNHDLGSTVADHIKKEALLRQQLTESVDKVASLQVVVNNQYATIKHHEQVIEECAQAVEKKPESTQLPPPDLSKKVYKRDKRGHFTKN